MDVELTTNKFLQLHCETGDESLTKLYDTIKCISIPDWFHDQGLFSSQINVLKSLIGNLLQHQFQKREKIYCALSQLQWCSLISRVIDKFKDTNLRIGTVMGELISTEHSLAKSALTYFNIIYDARLSTLQAVNSIKDVYLDCRSLTIQKLATMIIADLRRDTKTLNFKNNGNLLSQYQNEVIEIQLEKWTAVLEDLRRYIRSRAPCCACYEGYRDRQDRPVYCTQEYGQHDNHRSNTMVIRPQSEKGGLKDKIEKKFKNFLDSLMPAAWNGEFDFGGELPTLDQDKELLKNHLKKLQELNSQEFFEECLGVIKTAAIGKLTVIPDKKCFICQVNKCNRRIVPCGHTFCEYCAMKLTLIKSDCPICRSSIQRMIIYEQLSFTGAKVVSKNELMQFRKILLEL